VTGKLNMSLDANAAPHRFRLLQLVILLAVSGVLIYAGLKAPEVRPAQKSARLESEIVTVTPAGFEPAEITRPRGRFLLGVDNRSGLEDIQLRLERVDGSRVPVVEARKRRLSWREEVELPPGRYVIRESNHREWNCLITITSR
jgi:hypothetical protein